MSPFVFVLGSLAAWRLTVAITEDSITRPFRGWVAKASLEGRAPGPAATLVLCTKCLGFWMSGAVFAWVRVAGLADTRMAVLGWLAAAAVVSALAVLLDRR